MGTKEISRPFGGHRGTSWLVHWLGLLFRSFFWLKLESSSSSVVKLLGACESLWIRLLPNDIKGRFITDLSTRWTESRPPSWP